MADIKEKYEQKNEKNKIFLFRKATFILLPVLKAKHW